MAAHRPPAFRGRAGERELLDRLLDERARRPERGAGHPRRGGRRQDGAPALLRASRPPASGSRRSPASSPRWSCRSRGCISSARRCSARLDALPEPQQARPARRARPLVRRRSRPLPRRAWPRSACWPRSPRSGRCSASSTTRSGSTAPRRRSSASSRDGCWRSRWRSCSRSASRATSASSSACRSCALGGLDDEDARALLATVIPGRLDERVRDRIVAETRGNPLALLELPARALGGAAGGRVRAAGRCCRCRAGSRRASCGGSRSCRDETRLLLLVAAAEPVGDPALMWRAATRLGIARHGARARGAGRAAGRRRAGALPPSARALGRLPVGVRARAPDARTGRWPRRPMPTLDPDRRAWHRAQATPGPDEDVAAELERSAGRAQARGGLAAAAAFLGRAADLTIDPARRAERMLAAAQANLHAGAFDAALGLLAAARGRAAGRARARPRGSAAGRGRLRPEPRQRRAAAAAPAPRRTLEPLDVAARRARPTSTRGARRCSPGAWRAPAACSTSPGP